MVEIEYRLPEYLSDFQREMYEHLCRWKDRQGIVGSGFHAGRSYDVLLPEHLAWEFPHLYPTIRDRFRGHQRKFRFKLHRFANHLASSQIACANLFLPLLEHPDVGADVLRTVKPDLGRIATEFLDKGFRIEFWDETTAGSTGLLGDHSARSGTDSDIAIAYYDTGGALCLWLVEHKLTEAEFTTCGAYRSKANATKPQCDRPASVYDRGRNCYYTGTRKFAYWPLTAKHDGLFSHAAIATHKTCPFKGGMNQLWRNLLLAAAIETTAEWPYERVYFSVVHHPGNEELEASIAAFNAMLVRRDRFSWFTSDRLVRAASILANAATRDWAEWITSLYFWTTPEDG